MKKRLLFAIAVLLLISTGVMAEKESGTTAQVHPEHSSLSAYVDLNITRAFAFRSENSWDEFSSASNGVVLGKTLKRNGVATYFDTGVVYNFNQNNSYGINIMRTREDDTILSVRAKWHF